MNQVGLIVACFAALVLIQLAACNNRKAWRVFKVNCLNKFYDNFLTITLITDKSQQGIPEQNS